MSTDTTETTLFTQLEKLVEEAKVDYAKLRDKGVQARATAFRKKMQDLKKLAQDLRTEALDLRKDAKERRTQARASS